MGVKPPIFMPVKTDDTLKDTLQHYKIAVKDARYILNHYRHPYPNEAWDTLIKILHDPKLK